MDLPANLLESNLPDAEKMKAVEALARTFFLSFDHETHTRALHPMGSNQDQMRFLALLERLGFITVSYQLGKILLTPKGVEERKTAAAIQRVQRR